MAGNNCHEQGREPGRYKVRQIVNAGRRPPHFPVLLVLVADGHVAADGLREVPTGQLSSPPGSATWKDAKLMSWEDFDADFGTMGHIVPERSFTTNP